MTLPTKPRTIGAFAIIAAHKGGIDPEFFRADALAHGVRKGTASKCVTILTALAEGTLLPEQVSSLGQAYERVKMRERAIQIAFDVYVDHSDYSAADALLLTESEWQEYVTPKGFSAGWHWTDIKIAVAELTDEIVEGLAR